MFGGEASDKKVGILSGGERSRLAMIRLLLEPVNVLILDEPTNHLDMRSKDVLKEALLEFDGTIIVVSHDREFLDGLVSKVYEFGNQQVKEHLGGIYEFLERKKIDNLQELERKTIDTTEMPESQEQSLSSKLSYEALKEQNRALKRIEKAITEAEQQIERLEKEITALEERLATAESTPDMAQYSKYEKLKHELAQIMDTWTEKTLELEKNKL